MQSCTNTRHPKRYQRGLSLLDTIVVVTLIGLWVAFTLPYYHSFYAQPQIAEAISLVNDYQTAVIKSYQQGICPNNNTPALSDTLTGGIRADVNINSKSIAKVTFAGMASAHNANNTPITADISTGCTAMATFRNDSVSLILSDKIMHFTLMQTPTGFRFRCDKGLGTTVDTKQLPASCE